MHSMEYFKSKIDNFSSGSKNHTFFSLILKKIEPDFLRDSVRKQVNENSASLRESIRQYFKYHIILNAALKALEKEELQKKETMATPCRISPKESDVKNIELFYLNLLKTYLHSDNALSELKFFEMIRTFLPGVLENKRQQQPEFPNLLTKFVESNITEFCIKLAEYSTKKKLHARDWKVQFNITMKELSQKATFLDSISIHFKQHSTILQNLVSTYYQELVEGMDILQKLLNLYHQKLNFQSTSALLFTEESKAMKLRMRCLELEAMTATYTKDSLKALRIISEQLDAKAENTEKELVELNDRLLQYKFLGPEYEELVEQYRLLVQNIKKQEWALKSLKATEGEMSSEILGT